MTVVELANKFNTTVPEILGRYKHIFIDISDE
jgi:hypothetical protein